MQYDKDYDGEIRASQEHREGHLSKAGNWRREEVITILRLDDQ